ncbi:hypothetical protein KCU77_g11, partial [Aureobasidium melanogenum]
LRERPYWLTYPLAFFSSSDMKSGSSRPKPTGAKTFVAITMEWRFQLCSLIAFPRIISESPFEYTLAVSKKFKPEAPLVATFRIAEAQTANANCRDAKATFAEFYDLLTVSGIDNQHLQGAKIGSCLQLQRGPSPCPLTLPSLRLAPKSEPLNLDCATHYSSTFTKYRRLKLKDIVERRYSRTKLQKSLIIHFQVPIQLSFSGTNPLKCLKPFSIFSSNADFLPNTHLSHDRSSDLTSQEFFAQFLCGIARSLDLFSACVEVGESVQRDILRSLFLHEIIIVQSRRLCERACPEG